MSSNVPPSSGTDPAIAGRPSYESFLRIKQGIGNDALRAAGLPSAEHLSYDAYVTALNRKAAVSRGHEAAAPVLTPTPEKTHGRSAVWTGIVVGPIAIAFIVLLAGILKDRPGADPIPSGTEAIAAPLTTEGLPIALSLTAMEDMPMPPLPLEMTAASPAANTESTAPEMSAVETVQADAPVELLVTKPVAKKQTAAGLVPKETAVSAVMPAPERRVAPERKKQTTTTRQSRGGNDFWQPLVDLLNGNRGTGNITRNMPGPQDREDR
jgi:hypothetical protein